jgi:hypothetical protein
MRPLRVVLQIPPKSFVPRRLLFYKSRPPLTPSESTLLQVLIPLHFNSSRMNTYKKPGRGAPSTAPKLSNSLLTPNRKCAHTPTSATPVPSMLYFTVLCIPRNLICTARLLGGRRLSFAGACLRSRGPRDFEISRRTWRSQMQPGSAWLRAG